MSAASTARRGPGKVTVYLRMLGRWARMARGTSYWHVSQGPGRCFRPDRLEGYYNDLTGKTAWEGPVDADGLPYVVGLAGAPLYFPTTLLQKALGHWDAWLVGGRREDEHLAAFLRLAAWALRHQDAAGGWPIWPLLGLAGPSAYSAMTQGEGASVLVRAEAATGDRRYREAAGRAVRLMLLDVAEGGTARRAPEGLVLEEEPAARPTAILNGWVFALYGLHDWLLAAPDAEAERALDATLRALVAFLPRYEAGFWSYYDVTGRLASPFYHRLHVAQLGALARTFPAHAAAFDGTRARFEAQAGSRWNEVVAIALKAGQKLADPPPVVLG